MLQYEARVDWRSGPVNLPVSDAQLVPGFPGAQHAVLLVTGKNGNGFNLAGAPFEEQEEENQAPPKFWTVHLPSQPVRTACDFLSSGPINLVYSSETSGTTRLIQLAVDSGGRVITPPKEIYSTNNSIRALTNFHWPGVQPLILGLEESKDSPDRLRLISVTMTGQVAFRDIGPIPAWPQSDGHPITPTELAFAMRPNAVPLIAFLDGHGGYWGGALNGGPLRRLNGTDGPALLRPHIAVLEEGIMFSAFTQQGILAHFNAF
jgi:hypothetical protein